MLGEELKIGVRNWLAKIISISKTNSAERIQNMDLDMCTCKLGYNDNFWIHRMFGGGSPYLCVS